MYSFPNMLFLHKSLMFPTSSLSRCMLCCLWEMFLAFTRTVCAAAAALMLPTRCFITLGTARDPLSQKSQAGMCVEQSHAKFFNRRYINSVFSMFQDIFRNISLCLSHFPFFVKFYFTFTKTTT